MPRRFVSLCLSSLALGGTLPAQPTLSLTRHNGTVDESFSNIVAIQELPDGRVIVADAKERRLAIIDFARGTVQQLGRNGNGPNEYSVVQTLYRGRADTVLLLDFPARRLLRIAPNGTLAGTVTFDISVSDSLPGEKPAGDRIITSPRAMDATGSLFYEVSYLERGKGVRPERLIARWDPVSKTSRQVAAVRSWYPERSARWRGPFMYQDAWAVAPDGRLARVVPLDYHVEWYKDGALVAKGGPVAIEPVRVTKEDRDAWYQARTARGGGTGQVVGPPPSPNEKEENKRATVPRPPGFTDADFPATKPPFVEDFTGRAAVVSPEGELWVTRSTPFGANVSAVDVFDGAGKLTRRVTFPATHRVGGFGKAAVYLVRTDDDGLQWVERYTRQ
jgi:hypothetical protein